MGPDQVCYCGVPIRVCLVVEVNAYGGAVVSAWPFFAFHETGWFIAGHCPQQYFAHGASALTWFSQLSWPTLTDCPSPTQSIVPYPL
eukprot:4404615-Karenia_brevis.AAC.1